MTDGDRSQSAGRPPGASRPAGGHRQPGLLPSQRRVLAQIAAGQRARQQRVLLALLAVASSLVLAVSGGAWALTSYITAHVHRLNAGTAGTPTSGPPPI